MVLGILVISGCFGWFCCFDTDDLLGDVFLHFWLLRVF